MYVVYIVYICFELTTSHRPPAFCIAPVVSRLQDANMGTTAKAA
jgi:hypothetical protein